MRNTRIISKWPILGLVAILTVVIGGLGIAYATGAIPSGDGTINACYNGQHVRLVEDAGDCKKNETAIFWNQQGPQGLPGADGADGQPGIRTLARSHGFAGPTAQGIDHDSVLTFPAPIDERSLVFDKNSADTGIRVPYTDNLRCLGLTVGCQWEIRFDGNKCAPPELTFAYFDDNASHSDMNIHRSHTVTGTCFGLADGEHTIQIYIAPVPNHPIGDFHTGWRSYWAIEAEEVN